MKKILIGCIISISCVFSSTNMNKQIKKETKKECSCFENKKNENLKLLKKNNDSKEKFICVEKSKTTKELKQCKPLDMKQSIKKQKDSKIHLNLENKKNKLNLENSKPHLNLIKKD